MTLGEAVEHLEDLDQAATLFAVKPWSEHARAAVAIEPEDGSVPPEAAGLDYFLEVSIALEAAQVTTARTRFERVLYYAQNDAYLFEE